MSRRSKGPRIPSARQRNYKELDYADTKPTEELSDALPKSGVTRGPSEDVGPAFPRAKDTLPVTFGDLRVFSRIGGLIFAAVASIGGGIWWAATIQGDVNKLSGDVDKIEVTTRTLDKSFVRQDEKLHQIRSDILKLQKMTENKNQINRQ
ncbi:MAG: hypothetical protein DBP02_10120 [gamma proteobacterium symbiont of Ctena orbiculata]|nr:MAG: hypothetical protein DBP02_10120 [gamma proteobacterium symbiont of Ctena orbiculata]